MLAQEKYTTTADNLFAASQMMPVVADAMISEVYAVLAEDVDTTKGAVEAAVYLTGEFNENALSFKPDNDALVSDFKASARKVCIFFKPAI